MRKLVLASFAAFAITTAAVTPLQSTQAQVFTKSHPGSFANLAEKLLPAVVNISSTQKIEEPQDFPDVPQFPPGSPFEDFFEQFMERRGGGMPSIPPASLGSGFVIDAEKGYIITNNHVVKDADEVRVTFFDDETIEAEVIGRDEKTDIAVLKVDTDKELTAVEFGDSDPLRVGDWVLAIGNPFGLGGTVTAGIVSARQRDISAGPYDDFIQTDASINRGNSGGPMFNLDGQVIGINTAIFSPTGGSVGIGFAIPSALAKPVVKQIIQYGRTRRGWLGVRIQSVTDEIADSLGLDKARGALVASVTTDGPAEASGIQAGDVIINFNGSEIDEMRTLPRIVAETPIDSTANIVVWRDGKKQTLKVKVGELEKAEESGALASNDSDSPSEPAAAGTKIDIVGLTVTELTGSLRQDFDIGNEVSGVIVDEIERNSEAAKKGLAVGDVIVEINQQATAKPADVKTIIDSAVANKRSSVLLLINRDGDVRFVALKLKPKKDK